MCFGDGGMGFFKRMLDGFVDLCCGIANDIWFMLKNPHTYSILALLGMIGSAYFLWLYQDASRFGLVRTSCVAVQNKKILVAMFSVFFLTGFSLMSIGEFVSYLRMGLRERAKRGRSILLQSMLYLVLAIAVGAFLAWHIRRWC
jgi:hypothetical protein